MSKPTVFIVGAGGLVGATAAYTLAIKEVVHDIVLIDVAEELAQGQALDINHAAAYTNGVHVRTGDYSEIKENDIIVITCGLPRKIGQTRLDLLGANARIVRDVTKQIKGQGKPVYILVVANPVDALTQVALEVSGLPKNRVFGTGTTLDTARLRATLANQLNVSQETVEAYVLGEHGDSSFPALSQATIGNVPLERFPGFRKDIVANIEQDIRKASLGIIAAKKSTYYGIGHVVAKLVAAMVQERAVIYTVCSLAEGEYKLHNVVIGLPSLVSNKGVTILDKYPLTETELQRLHASAAALKAAYRGIQKAQFQAV